jgi:RNA polymerase sigma-70 factor (ECF subfamily)
MDGSFVDRGQGFFGWVTTLVHANRAPLVRLVRREGVRADDALDCVQEAFLSFLNLPQARLLVGQADESARMLSALARNIARNRRRRHDYARPHVVDEAIIEQIAAEGESADEIISRTEQHALALACLATLSEVQRAVVRLRLIDELPGENVAKQLGITPGHLAVLLHRAKQALRRCVDDAHNAGPRDPGRPRRPIKGVAPRPARPRDRWSGPVADQQKLRRAAGRDRRGVLKGLPPAL